MLNEPTLGEFIDLQHMQNGGEDRAAALSKIRSALSKLAESTPRYQCKECGFSSRKLLWQCPSCKDWETQRHRRPGQRQYCGCRDHFGRTAGRRTLESGGNRRLSEGPRALQVDRRPDAGQRHRCPHSGDQSGQHSFAVDRQGKEEVIAPAIIAMLTKAAPPPGGAAL